MATDVITVTCDINVENIKTKLRQFIRNVKFDQTTDDFIIGEVDTNDSGGTVSLAGVTTPGWFWLKNLEDKATNPTWKIKVGFGTTTQYSIEPAPQEVCMGRIISTATTMYWDATVGSSTPKLFYFICDA
jgi:hypothetical protein